MQRSWNVNSNPVKSTYESISDLNTHVYKTNVDDLIEWRAFDTYT